MNETLILFATAALFVGFGLLGRAGRACPGPEACEADDVVAGCSTCPHAQREVPDAEP